MGEREGKMIAAPLESAMRGANFMQQRESTAEAMRLARAQSASEEARAAAAPTQLREESELRQAQIAQAQAQAQQAGIASEFTRGQLERQAQAESLGLSEKEIALSVAKANRDIQQQPATSLGLADANPNETVAMYRLRKESEGDEAALKQLNTQTASQIASTNIALQKAPLEIEGIIAQNKNLNSISLQNSYNAKLQALELNSSTRNENVKRLVYDLRPYVQDPQAFAFAQKQMIDSGIPANEVIEAAAQARSAATGEDLQKALIEQASPMFQYKSEAIRQVVEYHRDINQLTTAASKLMTIGERVGNLQVRDSQEMQQAKQILIEAFDRHGMTKYSDALRSPVTLGPYGIPRSDKDIADEGINLLAQRMQASMLSTQPGTIGDVSSMTPVQQLLRDTNAVLQKYGWQNNYEKMQQQNQNSFGGITNVNFQNLGGQP